MKFPKTIGAATDLLYTLQQQRLEKSREADALKEQEKALSDHIRTNMLPALGLDGAKGNMGQVSLQDYDYAEIEDWDAYFKYIAKNKAWELVQKRESITALRELWDAGKKIPGVERKEGKKLHVSKVGSKK